MTRTEKLQALAKYYDVSVQTIRIMVQQGLIPGAYTIKNKQNRMYIFEPDLIRKVSEL